MTDVDVFYPYYVVRRSPQIDQIATALAKAQGSASHPIKNRENTHFKNTYADLSAVIDSGKVLSDNGIAVFPSLTLDDKALTHTLLLAHESGQWIESDLAIPLSKADAQGVGSALTYARRYHLSMMLNVASETDDDGNAAAAQSRRSQEHTGPPPAPLRDTSEPQLLTPTDIDKIVKAASEVGAAMEDVAAWVTTATAGRKEGSTALLAEVRATEIPALRAARDAWLAGQSGAVPSEGGEA